jgi:hypothetical protein
MEVGFSKGFESECGDYINKAVLTKKGTLWAGVIIHLSDISNFSHLEWKMKPNLCSNLIV